MTPLIDLQKPALAAGLLLIALGPAAAQSLSIHCPTLLDVEAGRLLKDRVVSMEYGLIKSVSAAPGDGQADIVLQADSTCLPGLTDLHVHLSSEHDENTYQEQYELDPGDVAFRMVPYAEKTLLAGFTTVRDLGDDYNLAAQLRDAIAAGHVKGPRIFAATKGIGTTGGHADPTNGYRADLRGDPGPKQGVINGPYDAREAVRHRYKDGANLIKITATAGVLSAASSGDNSQFTADELTAIVETARDYGFHVAAHAHGAAGIKRAVRAGVRTIEHGSYLDDEGIALMKQKGAWLVPTIMAGKWVAQHAEIDGFFPDVIRPKARTIGPVIEKTFTRAYKAGVKIGFGTDSGVSRHGDNAWEFVYMVAAGMPPLAAIRSATINAAEILDRRSRQGALKAGMVADLVAVRGDPLDNIAAIRNVELVIKDGTVYKQPQGQPEPAKPAPAEAPPETPPQSE